MANKQVYDLRGRQSSMLRLWRFNRGALLHMLSNRILAFLALIAAVVMIMDLYSPSYLFGEFARIMLLLVWIFFTPQLFAALKAFSLVYSRGGSFGHLNKAFVRASMKSKGIYTVYTALPYVAMAVWLLGFAGLTMVWFG